MADNILGVLGEAVVLLRADGSKLSEDMKKEKANLEKQLDDLSSGLKGVGGGLTAAVTAPIVAMGTAAVAAGLQIDEALDTIRLKSGQTGESLAALEEDFTAVFTQVPDDAKTVADALSLIFQRTGQTGDGLQALTTQLLTLSRVTETDVKANVDAATQAFNAWQVSTDKQGESLDFIFKVSQQTGASVTELMQNVTAGQATFQSLNLNFEQSVALLGQMTKAGVDTGGSMAALKKAVISFNEAGIDAGEGLTKTLKLIKDLGPGSQATALAVDVFGQKAGPQLATAIQQGRLSIDELLATVKGSKETIMGAAADTDGFAESFSRLKNKAIVALEPIGTKLIELGERALPYLEKLGNIALQAADFFSELPGPVQMAAIAIAGIAAAAGPVIYVAGTIIGSYKEVIGVWDSTAKMAGSLTNAMPGLASGLGLVAKGASVVGVAFAGWQVGKWIGETSGLTDQIERWTGKLMGLTDAEINAGMAARKQYEATQGQTQATTAASTATADLDKSIQSFTAGLGRQTTATSNASREATAFSATLKTQEEKQKAAEEAAKKHAEALEKQENALKSLGLVTKGSVNTSLKEFADIEKYALEQGIPLVAILGRLEPELIALHDAAKKSGVGVKETGDALARVQGELAKTIPSLNNLVTTGTAGFLNLGKSVQLMTTAQVEAMLKTRDLEAANKAFGTTSQEEARKTAAEYARLYEVMLESGKYTQEQLEIAFAKVEEAAKKAANNSGVAWGSVFAQTLQGALSMSFSGGSVAQKIGGIGNLIGTTIANNASTSAGKALGMKIAGVSGAVAEGLPELMAAKTKKAGALAGAKMGASIGTAIMPGIGTAIGAGVGALGGLIKGWLGGRNEGRKMVEDFAKGTFGSFEQMHAQLGKLGAEGERLWIEITQKVGKGDKEGAQKAIEKVTKALTDYDAKQKQILQDELDARDKLQSAIDKYGFTIEELGPKWQQQALDEKAQELIEDYTVLTASGIEVDTVIGKMGDSIQDFVTTALKTGSEVPEAMRPMLQEMVRMGTLTDASGNKIEDLETSGINFSMTLSQGFKAVTDKLTELINKITGDLTRGLNNIPSPTVKVGVQYDYGDGPAQPRFGASYDAANNPADYPELDKGGYANWGTGTTAVLHGHEAVMPIDRLQEMVAGAGPQLTAEDMVAAMKAGGLDRPNINFAPEVKGALADEMYDFAQRMWPVFIRVLQDNGTLNSSLSNTIGAK